MAEKKRVKGAAGKRRVTAGEKDVQTEPRLPEVLLGGGGAIPEAMIAKRAHEIWEREGKPEGRDREHWLRAEKELRGID